MPMVGATTGVERGLVEVVEVTVGDAMVLGSVVYTGLEGRGGGRTSPF